MAKRKPKPQQQKFNPFTYLKSGNARRLPLLECLIPENWEKIKKFPVLVARKHVNGNLTFTSVLVDLLCTGAKDVLFFVNESESVYRDIIERYEQTLFMKFNPASYELVHNIVFESIAFAEEFGIAPHEDFRFSELIMEANTDDFPLVDIPLGENGLAYLYLNPGDERADYFERQIAKYGKEGTYKIVRTDFDPIFEDELSEEDDLYENTCFSWDELEWEEFYDEGEFDNLSVDVVYFTLSKLPDFNYQWMKKEKLFQPFLGIKSTEKPVSEYLFSDQEIIEMEEIYGLLEDLEEENVKGRNEIFEIIEQNIQKWPKNRVLWQYKWEYFQRTGKDDKALHTALEMKQKFPDYIFGLTCHAQSLMERSEVDSIPEAMNFHTKIQEFDPKRKKFHLSELMSFYSPWIYYYSKTGQLRSAYFLVNFLIEHGVLIKNAFHPIINEAYMSAATERANLFYEDVKSGRISRDEFLDIMLD
ncbi:hypothetical protein [Arthrospiribacter ruber]|uniref:Uncharacterized protein n=1 Tax=Arthrospiribacter ruber TaxID=2487934 RepID=A0A951IZC2_9BACT|nr:hypothetical protein [Arthrospiribacter ruber]MBW3469633.1 hypothetical protein [Arthrospiribacter ruber]